MESPGDLQVLKYLLHVPSQVGNPGTFGCLMANHMVRLRLCGGVQGPQVTHLPQPFQLFYLEWCTGCQSACQPLLINRLPPPSLIREHSFLSLVSHHRQILAVTRKHGHFRQEAGKDSP